MLPSTYPDPPKWDPGTHFPGCQQLTDNHTVLQELLHGRKVVAPPKPCISTHGHQKRLRGRWRRRHGTKTLTLLVYRDNFISVSDSFPRFCMCSSFQSYCLNSSLSVKNVFYTKISLNQFGKTQRLSSKFMYLKCFFPQIFFQN